MAEHVRLKVDKSQLLCKNGCGFFGNPEWDWYCSKCWRQHNTKQQHNFNFDSTANLVNPSPISSQSLPAALNKEKPSPYFQSLIRPKTPASGAEGPKKTSISQQFSILEDKSRKHVQTLERKTSSMKQMFKKSKDELVKSRSPTRSEKPGLPPEAKTISKEFADYLGSRVRKSGMADLSRNIQGFIEKVHKRVEILPIEEISAMVQNFYQALAKRLETHENFAGLQEDERTTICDLTERYIMVCCYKQLFCPFSTTDEDKDLEIQEKIRKLNWVTPSHLDCPFKETSSEIRDLIYQAINDILQVDGFKAPQDKLKSVVSCAKKIFSVIQAGEKNVASADDFLPSLIFILLRANPPRIQSNINFITRFSNETRLRSGEEGYYFTNLCCALNFIESLTATSLNLPQSEFDSFMSGEIPPGSWGSTLIMCEGIQSVNSSLASMKELEVLQANIVSECERLEKEMQEFQSFISTEVARVMANTEYTIREPKKPVTVDALSPQTEENLLPPPLLPQNLTPAASTSSLDNMDLMTTAPKAKDAADGGSASTNPEEGPSSLLTQYIGFSVQSASIPSISCNIADTMLTSPSPHSMQHSASSFTPSSTSSSLHSLASPSSSPSHTMEKKDE